MHHLAMKKLTWSSYLIVDALINHGLLKNRGGGVRIRIWVSGSSRVEILIDDYVDQP